MKKAFLLMILVFSCTLVSYAQKTFEPHIFRTEDGYELNYRVLEPEHIKPRRKYPLVIFLHGMGERGNDNVKQLVHGSEMFLNPVNKEKYPAYVIFPQCPEDKMWAYSSYPLDLENLQEEDITAPMKAVKELIDTYIDNPSVDPSRIYIMGLSMGGLGTYDIVARFPETFAAAIPICGAAKTDRLKSANKVYWRIFHGDADTVVPVKCSRNAYKALKEAKADVEYIEFPGCGHNSWNPAFCRPDFMKWIFSKRRR